MGKTVRTGKVCPLYVSSTTPHHTTPHNNNTIYPNAIRQWQAEQAELPEDEDETIGAEIERLKHKPD